MSNTLFRYSIDVLSNGFEYTNCCCSNDNDNNNAQQPATSALFLSIWKVSKSLSIKTDYQRNDDNNVDDTTTTIEANDTYDNDENQYVLLARYAISDIGIFDGIGRMAADQKYKLGNVRAIFFNMNHCYNTNNNNNINNDYSSNRNSNSNSCYKCCSNDDDVNLNDSNIDTKQQTKGYQPKKQQFQRNNNNSNNNILYNIASLPSLLYKNQQASISLIVPYPSNMIQRIEQMIQLVHGNHTYPKILLCPISEQKLNQQQQNRQIQWWKVYNDDQIVVHVCRYENDDTSNIIYSISFHQLINCKQQYITKNKSNQIDRFCNDSILILPSYEMYNNIICCQSQSKQLQLQLPIIDVVIPTDNNNNQTTTVDHQLTILRTFVLQQQQQHGNMMNKAIDSRYDTSSSNTMTTPITFLITPQYPMSNRTTTRTCSPTSKIDNKLYVRGQQQTLLWRKHCNPLLLNYFPFIQDNDDNELDKSIIPIARLLSNIDDDHKIILQTGTSIMFDVIIKNDDCCSNKKIISSSSSSVRIMDRSRLREQESFNNNANSNSSCDGVTINDTSKNNVRYLWPNQLHDFLLLHNSDSNNFDDRANYHDENEIDLDDTELENETNTSNTNNTTTMNDSLVPQLLVLGTGCASPSPYRNASGYVLIIPNDVITTKETLTTTNNEPSSSSSSSSKNSQPLLIAIEVGEGYCTQFHRYAIGRSFSEIQLIFISHAHWDHYGGLVNLILQIYYSRRRQFKTTHDDLNVTERECKRLKSNNTNTFNTKQVISPPWVIAPTKVLQYLKLIFNDPNDYYIGVHQDDSTLMQKLIRDVNISLNRPILNWINIRVDHSCPAYGFILILQLSGRSSPFAICFSGDTRPCKNLVDQCRVVAKQYNPNGRIDLLIHEATFDMNEVQMSFTKKHSTVQDAIMVGRDIDAERLLLTHFSQRYDTVPDVIIESKRYHNRMSIGFALDGMKVIL